MPIFGAIYVIHPKVSNGNTKIYVGSTKQRRTNKRKDNHKEKVENAKYRNHNDLVYRYIRENGGWNAFKMSVIEEREDFEDEIELRKREQFHLDRVPLFMRLNEQNAYVSEEQRKEYHRKYAAEHIAEYAERTRIRRAKNRDAVNKQGREYWAKNRDKFNKLQRERRAKKRAEALT
jgi:hypothetical protein